MPRLSLPLFLISLLSVAITSSCATIPRQIDPLWTEDFFFKNAQIAMDENRYKTALFYYEVLLVRYPENLPRVIAAEYELTFIHYKMGHYKEAEKGYNDIIKKYEESPYAMLYPIRFLKLSRIGLTNIEKKRSVENSLFWRLREKEWAEERGEALLDKDEDTEN